MNQHKFSVRLISLLTLAALLFTAFFVRLYAIQVVQAGSIAENLKAFGRCLPPCTKAQNTHRGDGDRYP